MPSVPRRRFSIGSALALLFSLVGCQSGSSDSAQAAGPDPVRVRHDLADGRPQAVEVADLVIRNAKVVTVDPDRPEAEALAIKGDRIQMVGLISDVAPYIGPQTRVMDLPGKMVIPGFIEGHGHFTGIGDAKMQLDLTQARSWQEIEKMVASAAEEAEPGAWIRGRGWHQEKWERRPKPAYRGLPLNKVLSKVSPENPVILTHASGHAAFANRKALEVAGVDRKTKNPGGGQIERDGYGEPTGMLRETAAGLVYSVMSKELVADPSLARTRVDLATQECLSKGITSFQDAGSSFETVDLLRKMADEGELGLRLWVMLREPNEELAKKLADYKLIGHGNNYLTVRAIKRSIDGALGSHGAWLLRPYRDRPASTGLNTTPLEELTETARLAKENGYQLCVHAIGDRGNRETLDLFERTLGADAKAQDHRWRVEHAQHLHPDDLPRFAEIGAIASMQGVHCTSDGPWVVSKLGKKRAEEGAYMWRALMDSGALVTNGTDAPVEDVSPLASFHATVTRRMTNGERFYPGQKLDRTTALRTYTLNAAHAAFEEGDKGSLIGGKLADLTVLDKDILTIPEDEILTTKVVMTIVGGKVAYEAKAAAEEPPAEEPSAEEPPAEEPPAEEPPAKEPPVAKPPASKTPAAKRRAAKRPAAKSPNPPAATPPAAVEGGNPKTPGPAGPD